MNKIDNQAILADLEGELASVSEERDRLVRREAALHKAIAGHRELASLNGGRADADLPKIGEPVIARNAFQKMEIVAAAVAYLRVMHKGQRNNEILNGLLRGGKKTTAATVRSVLKRNAKKADSELVKNGELWELKEWWRSPSKDILGKILTET